MPGASISHDRPPRNVSGDGYACDIISVARWSNRFNSASAPDLSLLCILRTRTHATICSKCFTSDSSVAAREALLTCIDADR